MTCVCLTENFPRRGEYERLGTSDNNYDALDVVVQSVALVAFDVSSAKLDLSSSIMRSFIVFNQATASNMTNPGNSNI
jgi:hypothetical protein